jgi:hypothetical protein
MTVTNSRVVQFMRRPIHHSSAQLIMTGTMVSSDSARTGGAAQRPPLELPAPTLTAPPIFTQDDVPSTLTKPGP